eukprot:scaffold523_cov446-Prasinococcus_capsulatus_cf.AAC.16
MRSRAEPWRPTHGTAATHARERRRALARTSGASRACKLRSAYKEPAGASTPPPRHPPRISAARAASSAALQHAPPRKNTA